MKINVYDISGCEQYVQAESFGDNDIQAIEPKALRNLLINPRNPRANKMPYLQDPASPCIDDFVIGNDQFDYSNSKFLSNMLEGKLSDVKEDLTNYFAFQNGIIASEGLSDCNIILIPDHYDAEKQEQLLRYCGLPRENTLLLWRSVAICLGAEKELRARKIKENSKVAIVDPQSNNRFNVTILTMKKDGDVLVPSRSSFRKQENYLIQQHPINEFQQNNLFWQHTWNREGCFYVPGENGTWSRQQFAMPKYYYSLNGMPSSIDYFIVCTPDFAELKGGIAEEKIIREGTEDFFALTGGGRFAVRNENDLPTYFDECESLYFIVQDRTNERIVAKELIKGDEYCRGGKVIEGEVNTDYELEKDQDKLSLLLYVGMITPDTQLKELIYTFEEKTEKKQPLTLYPSMIPGQGIAKVQVEARPLINNPVELDFLTMQDAFVHNENGTITTIPKTINYLESVFPRSFPIDFPEVEASPALFNTYVVKNYVYNRKSIDNGAFALSRYPNINAIGIERFERINVFGTKKGHTLPTTDQKLINDLFKKIADDYKRIKSPDNTYFIRLAAWTYRCGIEQFKDIISDTIAKVRHKAANPSAAVSISPQEFTVCANMLSESEQREFILCFNQYAAPIVKDSINNNVTVTKVDNWIRALMGLLMYSNNCLKNLSSADCEQCVRILSCIWWIYDRSDKKDNYITKVISCLLFILRRRKFDYEFLKNEQYSSLLKQIKKQCTSSKLDIATTLLQYLDGKGSLDSLAGFASNDN